MEKQICRSCGGDLERIGNYYVCRFCGSKWIIDADSDVHVIDRANAWSALRDCDFEKAMELFENIIFKEPENHEAYWGRALASAGIMYVTDLDEHKKVPTCNSISEFSFVESKDVQRAIALAPQELSETYKKQAEQIEAIRVEWMKKARKEKPYDIFICYKDSDRENNIERTDDSYDAHELYNALTAEGYKVFFSRVSLRDKVSEHYEPYIYNALKTAKVMIVFGEKTEYFNAVWVKNEWTRFRAMIERGEKDRSSLVVVYKNMTPDDLPVGLKSRQCLNAGEMTFLQALLRHIKLVIEPPQRVDGATDNGNAPTRRRLSKSNIIFIASLLIACIVCSGVFLLYQNNYDKAVEYIEFGKYEDAVDVLKKLGGFRDSDVILEVILLIEDGQYDAAYELIYSYQDMRAFELLKQDCRDNLILKYLYNEHDEATVSGVSQNSPHYIKIPSSFAGKPVTEIGDRAFYLCDSLMSIVIPDSVTSIGVATFYDCGSLASIVIPDSVTSIGDHAFYVCNSLKTVYYTGTEEEWAKISIGSNNNCLQNATIIYNYVPE